VLLPKDYIRYCLTGDYAADLSDAAGMLLLDVAKRAWSKEVLDALQIPEAWMPQLYEGSAITGKISEVAAKATGLIAGTPVVGGGGDQAAGAVGMGAVKAGIVGLTVGTSGVVFAPLSTYAYDAQGRLHAFCHALPGQWHFMAVMLSAAGSLQWYRDTLAPNEDFGALVEEAASVPAGSEGLQFMPYLTGERTPHPDPLARGAFIGLSVRHTRAHMTRAVLEGVAFGLRDGFELIKVSQPIEQVRLSGGGARSRLWRQILADVLGAALTSVEETEGAAYGAALLAGLGAGVWKDVEAATTAIQLGETVSPRNTAVYDGAYGVYKSLYPTLKGTFAALSQL
jgi:xylulokinase